MANRIQGSIEEDLNRLEAYLAKPRTKAEIGAFLGCARSTIEKRVQQLRHRGIRRDGIGYPVRFVVDPA